MYAPTPHLAGKKRPTNNLPSDDIIKELYVEDRWTIKAIADNYGACWKTVKERLVQMGIARRPARPSVEAMLERERRKEEYARNFRQKTGQNEREGNIY